MYQIVEMFPIEEGNGIRELHVYDRLEDAEAVMAVLESVNYNFTCYAMIMVPVWEDERQRKHVAAREKRREELENGWDANGSPVFAPCDHNGSTSTLSTDGKYRFWCPKCGVKYGKDFE
jgi:hypothetical protein